MFVSTWVTNVHLITRVTNIPVLNSVAVVTDGPLVTFVTMVKLVIKGYQCYGFATAPELF